MNRELIEQMRGGIALFAEKIRAFEAGELDKKDYKGFSGGYGSYAQRNGGHMLRLRMAGGRLTKERLAFVADAVEKHGVERMKLTTCQNIQMHGLSAEATVDIMDKALDVDIVTRGSGGDHLRNAMASPLSGVERGEYFDVLPWAEQAAEYMLGRLGEIKMPRKLKVCFSNSPANVTHATFRDLGFAAREDYTFDVYCAGGLGPNPKVGIKVAEGVDPRDVLAHVDAMIAVFTAFGDYENRARARTRYLQETLGEEGLKAEYAKALAGTMTTSPKLGAAPSLDADKGGDGEIVHERVIPQKQEGLYAVSYHPRGGNLPAGKPRELYEVIKGMAGVEGRIAPDGTLYLINLTAAEAERVLAVTADSAVTPFQRSVSCVGGTVCTTGIRDSHGLLMTMLEAVEEAGIPGDALPAVHVSGCPSACGTHHTAPLGFQGAARFVDGKPRSAFFLSYKGGERQGEERMGENLGALLEEEIPAFMVELGRTVADSGLAFDRWLEEHEEDFRALAAKYTG